MKLYNIKAIASIFSAGFISLAASSNAQHTGNIKGTEPVALPVVTKGYYSIYRNAEKLKHTESQQASAKKSADQSRAEVKKGYYAIGKNSGKIIEQRAGRGIDFSNIAGAGTSGKSPFPVITKGYYSIGRNAEKLQK